jgi:hypothetical protein
MKVVWLVGETADGLTLDCYRDKTSIAVFKIEAEMQTAVEIINLLNRAKAEPISPSE